MKAALSATVATANQFFTDSSGSANTYQKDLKTLNQDVEKWVGRAAGARSKLEEGIKADIIEDNEASLSSEAAAKEKVDSIIRNGEKSAATMKKKLKAMFSKANSALTSMSTSNERQWQAVTRQVTRDRNDLTSRLAIPFFC